jgi:hypothetical protein
LPSSASLRARGFSTKTAFPASSALRVSSACELCLVTTKTASIVGSASTVSTLVDAAAKPNLRLALAADSADVVATCLSSTSDRSTRCGNSIDEA